MLASNGGTPAPRRSAARTTLIMSHGTRPTTVPSTPPKPASPRRSRVGYNRRRHGTALGRRFISPKARQGARHGDRLRRLGRGRADRLPARQSHVLLPLAQRHPARRRARPLSCSRSGRYGRFGEVAGRRLPLRRPCALPRRMGRRSAAPPERGARRSRLGLGPRLPLGAPPPRAREGCGLHGGDRPTGHVAGVAGGGAQGDRKSTRLNSSHLVISYAVFCLKKKKVPQCSSSHGCTIALSALRYLLLFFFFF